MPLPELIITDFSDTHIHNLSSVCFEVYTKNSFLDIFVMALQFLWQGES